MRSAWIAGAVLVTSAFVATAWCVPRHDVPPPADVSSPAATESTPGSAPPATLASKVATSLTPGPDQLALPDGTFIACLNGATGAPPLKDYWGSRPWSPIVGLERSDLGVDWYVHADGTRTTTEMKWRPDLGRIDAMTRLAVPVRETTPAAK
jgi:hypothetical protein